MDSLGVLGDNRAPTDADMPEVFFIDDDAFVIELMQAVVQKIEVDGAPVAPRCLFIKSGKSALDLVKSRIAKGKDAAVKVFFLDINLSNTDEMDGFELCDEIKTEYIGAEFDLPYITGLSSTQKDDVAE